MRRFPVLLSAVVVLFSSAVVLSQPTAIAQEATPAVMTMAEHPVVGMWRFTNVIDKEISFPSLAIFHADRTYIEDFPDAGSYSMGVWEPIFSTVMAETTNCGVTQIPTGSFSTGRTRCWMP